MSEPARHRRVRHVGALLVTVAAGSLLAISAVNAGGSDLRAVGNTDLAGLVRDRSRVSEQLTAEVERTRREVDELTAELTPSKGLTTKVEALGRPAGLMAEEGPGLTVTLDDAPLPDELPDNFAKDNYVIHQQDVEAVLNALWAGGAEAVSVMGQRVATTSAVKCVGPVLYLDGRQHSPPYRIAAIGDASALERALNASPEVALYRDYADRIGLGYDVEEKDQITVPAYEGSTDLSYVSAGDE